MSHYNEPVNALNDATVQTALFAYALEQAAFSIGGERGGS